MLILNLKTYVESTGENLFKLLDAVRIVTEEIPQAKDIVFVSPSMIQLADAKSKYPTLNFVSQSVDHKDAGSTTGWVTAENLLAIGVEHSVYNHSEHRYFPEVQLESLQVKGMKLIVCVENADETKTVLANNPFAVAYEPKDLIGSGVSVTTRPEAVKEFIEVAKGKTKVIIGAGVSTGEDVAKGLELGAEGFLLASAFVKAADPVAKLKELIAPYLK